METTLSNVLPELQAWFPPDDHKERKVPGGGKWFYLPFSAIRDRLNVICPGHWSDKYTLSHREADGDPIYLCELTICGVTHTGIGDKSNEDSTYGTPAQRAFRKAFTDAAEQFGIAAYLDDQKGDDRNKFLRYLQSKGDGRGVKVAAENGWLPGNLSPEATEARKRSEFAAKHPLPKNAASAKPKPAPSILTKRDRFIQLRTLTGHVDAQVKTIWSTLGFEGSIEALTEAQCLLLRDTLLLDWAMAQSRFKHLQHAQNSLNNLLTTFDHPPTDAALWTVWQEKVLAKPVLEEAIA